MFLCYNISFVFPMWCQPEACSGAVRLGAGQQGERHGSQTVVSWAEFSKSPPLLIALLLQLVDLDKLSDC